NLSGYNALTFWAKADNPAARFDTFGVANDNTGSAKYPATISNLAIGTQWAKYAMPLPLPARLSYERGLFSFAATGKAGAGYHVWLDDVRFEHLDETLLGPPVPHVTDGTGKPLALSVGDCPFSANATQTKIAGLDGPCANYSFFDYVEFPVVEGYQAGAGRPPAMTTLAVSIPPAYLTFTSADPGVAQVDPYGLVTAVGCRPGADQEPVVTCQTTVSARLGEVVSPDVATIRVTVPPVPTVKPPLPTAPASDVMALLARVYAPVVQLNDGGLNDSWGTDWSNGGFPAGGPNLVSKQVDGDKVKKYSKLCYVGIDFSSTLLDITQMKAIHLDVWTPEASAFSVKLVDFLPGADTTARPQGEVKAPVPAGKTRTWYSIDLDLSLFGAASTAICGDANTHLGGCLTSRAHLGQLILLNLNAACNGNAAAGNTTIYLDNVYFHR
ncbi:MAG TPA: hypothetical protein VMR96_09000, partial [Solirubrobacterales bacterium]|nr:hypothetical protein [Solirubrobacterales bacterium]